MTTKSIAAARTVADIMQPEVVTIAPDATVREIAGVLSRNRIGGAPVARGDDLIGMISARDVLWLADRKPADADGGWSDLDERVAEDIMTPDIFSVEPDLDLNGLRRFFLRTAVSRAPVLRDGELVGIVTLTDLLDVIARRVEAG